MTTTPGTDPAAAPASPPTPPPPPRTLVLGATGFIGRWLVLELLRRGEPLAAAVRGGRDTAKDRELRRWLRAHGADDAPLTTVAADLTRPGLGLSPGDEARLTRVRDVHNPAARYEFGLPRAEAHAANVDGALHVLHWAATRSGLRRLVHLSGYRVGRDPAPRHPLPDAETDALYARLGAYEASKQLGDAAVRVEAARLGVPLTTVNPSSVVGHSATGEAGQYVGPAELVRQLWHGRLPLLPGTARTFLPVVAVDHLARFLAAVPAHDHGPVHAHTVLDPSTPPLAELVAVVAEHLGVPAPRRLVPVGLVRRLPRALTGADPETLTFLSEDTYDTTSADRLADAAGLQHPPVIPLLQSWATRLVAEGFGAGDGSAPDTGFTPDTGSAPGVDSAPGTGSATPLAAIGFATVAGSRSFLLGDREAPRHVLLHGAGADADAWRRVAARLSEPALAPDLPGLGRSSGATAPDHHWLAELLAPARTRPLLVAHSTAAATALRYAADHPDRVSGLVLVAPPHLRPDSAVVAKLPSHRPGAVRRAEAALRSARRPSERARVAALLASSSTPVRLVPAPSLPQAGYPGELALTIEDFTRSLPSR
ncbi:alpha/beta fold hydrolase [Kitasatospora sp. CM 4170]|uniref:Alpha/beta fold hydrolase n=1 Tax=Kitasatospora aburaviensis TaxID=67265 RepID=A0ABW1F6K3_9ACTN|nr:alpha/beta fold hydrolase [Kitasatospora sp. CM 4170]WNM44133.1 alpha/beta fold hydrolase [Kitasatospora sp. CM 4170]